MAAATVFTVFGYHCLSDYYGTRNWKPGTGLIVKSELKSKWMISTNPRKKKYLDVAYDYTVNGMKYRGTQFMLGVNEFPRGDTCGVSHEIIIYYNPDYPDQAVAFRPESSMKWWIITSVSTALLIIGSGISIWNLFFRKKTGPGFFGTISLLKGRLRRKEGANQHGTKN